VFVSLFIVRCFISLFHIVSDPDIIFLLAQINSALSVPLFLSLSFLQPIKPPSEPAEVAEQALTAGAVEAEAPFVAVVAAPAEAAQLPAPATASWTS
jgi:hypothetical protein